MTDAEEIIKEREKAIIRKREKQIERVLTEKEKQVALKEARDANQQTGEPNPVSKNTAEVVVKDFDMPFSSALSLTVKFFFAGLIIALPIWLIFFVIMTS